jgi:uncharacterized protein with HEPN domain
MSSKGFPDFDTMTPADFEKYLPDFFATGDGRVSTDPRLQTFLKNNPVCAALVRDLETIAEHAKSLLEPTYEPSDAVWSGIQDKLKKGGPEGEGGGLPQTV